MISIAVCDDDVSITGKLDMLLQRLGKENFISLEIDVFWGGETLAESVEQGKYYDIIYLDIEMDKGDGISAAKRIRQFDKNVLIVYVSSHENYMKSTFDVRPFRFLTKPVTEIEFKHSFCEAYEEITSEDFYFRYRYQRINHKIPIKEILYFESHKRKISIVTKDQALSMYGKLNDIEKNMKNCEAIFLRIHQSFLVNYRHIVELAYDYVTIDDEMKIPISEDRRRTVSEQYCGLEDILSVD